MQSYYDGYEVYTGYGTGAAAGALIFTWLIALAVGAFMVVCLWKILKKAGKQGWECLIPIYSNIVLLEVAGLPTWYIILFFLPVANIYVTFKLYIELAHKFGKSTGYGIGMVFVPIVFFPMLAFDKNVTYSGNTQTVGQPTNAGATGMYCPNCGTVVDSNTVFCPNCGNRVK